MGGEADWDIVCCSVADPDPNFTRLGKQKKLQIFNKFFPNLQLIFPKYKTKLICNFPSNNYLMDKKIDINFWYGENWETWEERLAERRGKGWGIRN